MPIMNRLDFIKRDAVNQRFETVAHNSSTFKNNNNASTDVLYLSDDRSPFNGGNLATMQKLKHQLLLNALFSMTIIIGLVAVVIRTPRIIIPVGILLSVSIFGLFGFAILSNLHINHATAVHLMLAPGIRC